MSERRGSRKGWREEEVRNKRRERRQKGKEERKEEWKGAERGGSWVGVGHTPLVQAGGWRGPHTSSLQLASPSLAGCPQGPMGNSLDKMMPAFQGNKCAARVCPQAPVASGGSGPGAGQGGPWPTCPRFMLTDPGPWRPTGHSLPVEVALLLIPPF